MERIILLETNWYCQPDPLVLLIRFTALTYQSFFVAILEIICNMLQTLSKIFFLICFIYPSSNVPLCHFSYIEIMKIYVSLTLFQMTSLLLEVFYLLYYIQEPLGLFCSQTIDNWRIRQRMGTFIFIFQQNWTQGSICTFTSSNIFQSNHYFYEQQICIDPITCVHCTKNYMVFDALSIWWRV